MQRRAWTGWGGRAVAVALAWLLPAFLLSRADGDGGTAVRSADAFVDSVGVQTHGDFFDTAYADAARVQEAVARLGFRHVRDGITPNPGNERHLQFLERLGKAGVRLNLTIDAPSGPGAPLDQRLAVVRDRLLPYTESLEGPNEKDLRTDPAWPERVRGYQRDLYAAAKRDPALRRIPVLGPSLGRNANYPALGDLSDRADVANLHAYPGGLPPSRPDLGAELAAARRTVPGAPLVVTETGYHNGWNERLRQPFTSERAAGVYYPRLFLEHFAAGVRRTYAYELVDQKPDPVGADQEQHFGLLRNDFSPKPAAESVRRLLALARGPARGDPNDGPRALDLQVEAPAPVRHLVLRRDDGRLLVLLWQTASVWDRQAARDLRPPPVRADVALGATFADVSSQRIGPGAPGGATDLGARRDVRVRVPAEDVVALVLDSAPGSLPLPFILPPRPRRPVPPTQPPAPPAARREGDADGDPGPV